MQTMFCCVKIKRKMRERDEDVVAQAIRYSRKNYKVVASCMSLIFCFALHTPPEARKYLHKCSIQNITIRVTSPARCRVRIAHEPRCGTPLTSCHQKRPNGRPHTVAKRRTRQACHAHQTIDQCNQLTCPHPPPATTGRSAAGHLPLCPTVTHTLSNIAPTASWAFAVKGARVALESDPGGPARRERTPCRVQAGNRRAGRASVGRPTCR